MKKNKFKEGFIKGFKIGADFYEIHSVGDLFKVGFRNALNLIKIMFRL